MSTQRTYTYRNGRKVELEKQPDQFVVRVLPGNLAALGIAGDAQQVSSASCRVTTRAADLEADMGRTRHLAPTHHAYRVADTGKEFLITDRIFVTFREALSTVDVAAFAGRYGLIELASYGDRDHLFQLTDHTGMNPVKLVVKLTEDEPLVELAEHDLNQRMQTQQLPLPADPAYARQWHLHTGFSHPDFDPRASSRCEQAWQLLGHFGSPGVVVGITDDGCRLDHPDFNSPGKFAGWGYLRGIRLVTGGSVDADPGEMYRPGSNHGTSCAGVIAGEVDAVLTVGAAPGCRLLPVQWESSGPNLFISDAKMLTVLNFIADKVDVLSNSWSGVPINTWSTLVINRIWDLAKNGGRRGRGIVFLWAAGNENCPIQHEAEVDVPYTSGWEYRADGSQVWIGVETARRFRNNLVGQPGVMHVAALASTGQRSHYSNYGTGILICAPANNVHDYRRIAVRGLGITTTTGETVGITDLFGGTSSATPLVAGIAALTIAAYPDLTAEQVVSILKQTASKDLRLEGYPRTPPASYDPDPTWDVSPIAPFDRGDFSDIGDPDGTWSPWFGHGRVDALGAVAEALRRKDHSTHETIRAVSEPGREIPDNDPGGIRDAVTIHQELLIASIKVAVDISHTFIGDLRIALITPTGDAVMLHDRQGGGASDIRRTYDLQTTPGLSALMEQPTQGDWMLQVQDMAARDTGRLVQWVLEIEGYIDTAVRLEEAPGVTIPDNDPAGILHSLTTQETGQVEAVMVWVDISHTYIGDLRVSLVSPAGTRVTLHDRTGGARHNIITSYTPATQPALRTLNGEPVHGRWQLKVADLAGRDVGKLNRWGLKLNR